MAGLVHRAERELEKLERERRELPEKLASEREELRRRAKARLDKAIDRLKKATEEHEALGRRRLQKLRDEALRLVSGVLKESIRPGDIVVRWGGDEFVLVLRGAGHDAAKKRFTGLIATLEEVARRFPYEEALRVDWGVSSCRAPSDISRALAEADERMYAMKRRR